MQFVEKGDYGKGSLRKGKKETNIRPHIVSFYG